MPYLLVAAIAFYIAFRIGAWRQGCIHRAGHPGYRPAPAWRLRGVRVASWIILSVFAMAAAACILVRAADAGQAWLGLLGAGVLLYARWAASCYAAFRRIALEGVPLGGAPAEATRLNVPTDARRPTLDALGELVAAREEGMLGHAPAKKVS